MSASIKLRGGEKSPLGPVPDSFSSVSEMPEAASSRHCQSKRSSG
jgi:hypothetical protein